MFYQRIANYIFLLILLNSATFPVQAQNRDAVVAKLSETLGYPALKEAPYLMFSCVTKHSAIQGEHNFLYDWNNQQARFEGRTRDGQELIALFHTERKTGKIYINKKQIDNPDLLSHLIQLFEDDSFLLFTPLRVADRQLSAGQQETEIVNSRKYFVLSVETPGSAFEYNRLFIDSQNGKLSIWKTYDEKENKTHELVVSRIKDAGGGLTLPTLFADKVTGKTYQYPIVAALIDVEESKFKIP